MTLTQIQYVLAVAETGTISAAAKRLFIAQPSLTASIKELENELQVTLFRRTNKGVTLTPEGEEFLGYARQVNSQLDLMRERYFGGAPVRRCFCVSTQHYSFAVEAFVALLKEHGGETYDFHLRETQTYEIIEDVALLKSEVGVLYLTQGYAGEEGLPYNNAWVILLLLVVVLLGTATLWGYLRDCYEWKGSILDAAG